MNAKKINDKEKIEGIAVVFWSFFLVVLQLFQRQTIAECFGDALERRNCRAIVAALDTCVVGHCHAALVRCALLGISFFHSCSFELVE